MVWVVLWAGQALYEACGVLPVAQVLMANVSEYAAGNPRWVVALGGLFASLAQSHPLGLGAGLFVVEMIVGLGVLWGVSASRSQSGDCSGCELLGRI